MKLVKKILRLLPIIIVIISLFAYILYFKSNPEIDINTINEWFFTLPDNLYAFFYYIIENSALASLGTWFETNITDNGFYIFSISVLIYELFLSLAFLMFDFINMVFDWANKFIKKGSDLD